VGNPRVTSQSPRTLLIVDDEPDILAAFKALIEATLGVRVLTAASGPEGLEVLEREPVAVVVSDFKMPGMDGITFLAEVRRLHPAARRLMFTAYATPDIIERIRTADVAQEVVAKGGDPLLFLDRLRAILGLAPRVTGERR
jgi:response regulator RpfG family c-di-GMP phosphodiesterase